jgi:DNA-directed RNA polymerase subunit RPC12/RpoP
MATALLPLLLVPLAFLVQFVLQRSITSRYDFRCDSCGETFSLTPAKASIAPHRFGGSKYVRCPNCGVRSWVSRVPKQ